MYSKVLVLLVVCIGVALCTPLGAPSVACADMTPQHNGTAPQPLPSPYTFDVTSTPTGADITITAGPSDAFRGFFIQARDSSNTPVGGYTGPANAHTVDCAPGTANAFTHGDNLDKTTISFSWTAPTTPVSVTFWVSVVRVVDQFWVMQNIGTWAPAN